MAAGGPAFSSIAQSRLVAKFLTGTLGQRDNVTPCPKDCAGVPLFGIVVLACGRFAFRPCRVCGQWTLEHSPSFVSGASPDQEPAVDAVRARQVPMDPPRRRPMCGLLLWLVNWTQQVGRDHGFGLSPCRWPNGRQVSVIRCDGSLRRNQGSRFRGLRGSLSEGTPSTAPRFV